MKVRDVRKLTGESKVYLHLPAYSGCKKVLTCGVKKITRGSNGRLLRLVITLPNGYAESGKRFVYLQPNELYRLTLNRTDPCPYRENV